MSPEAIGWVVHNRDVYTYAPYGRAYGVATGYARGDEFVVEHVIVLKDAPAGTLLGLVHHALAWVWERYPTAIFCTSVEHPDTPRLETLGRRMGFEDYQQEGPLTWFAAHRPR